MLNLNRLNDHLWMINIRLFSKIGDKYLQEWVRDENEILRRKLLLFSRVIHLLIDMTRYVSLLWKNEERTSQFEIMYRRKKKKIIRPSTKLCIIAANSFSFSQLSSTDAIQDSTSEKEGKFFFFYFTRNESYYQFEYFYCSSTIDIILRSWGIWNYSFGN